jgi:hypothetical protein
MSFWVFDKERRRVRQWIIRQKKNHTNITSDMLWAKIKGIARLDDEDRELIFQQMGKWI